MSGDEKFRAALAEPRTGVAHGLAVLQHERIGQRVGRHFVFVVICDVSGWNPAERVAVGIFQRGGGGRSRRHTGRGFASYAQARFQAQGRRLGLVAHTLS